MFLLILWLAAVWFIATGNLWALGWIVGGFILAISVGFIVRMVRRAV